MDVQLCCFCVLFFFFKQKTAYEMRISDWSSDVCSSDLSLSAAIPTQGFRVTSGEPVIGGLHGTERHYFCPFCLSWLFTKPAGIDVFVNVRSTMLMEQAWAEPFIETFTSEKLNWAYTERKTTRLNSNQ